MGEKKVNIHSITQVRILKCALKDIFCTCGVKTREKETKGFRIAGNAGLRCNMYFGSNVGRYKILR